MICRDLPNINVARRPGLSSCTLHTFFWHELSKPAAYELTHSRWAHQPFFFLLLAANKQLLLCAENKLERRSGCVGSGALGCSRSRCLPTPPHTHNLSGACAVFSPPLTHFGACILSVRRAVNFVSAWLELVVEGRRCGLRLVAL